MLESSTFGRNVRANFQGSACVSGISRTMYRTPPLIPPPVPLSEGDKEGGRVSSSLVGEGSFCANTIRIWVGAIHELPLQVVI